jgi:tRNA-2-methylthio-N6-dimethylallyladenosine synthase
MTQKKLYIKSYGCQMNFYDSQKMADLLSPHGYEITDKPDDAHVTILNTCHIREKAEQKVYSDLGRIKPFKNSNDMTIVVAGCVAQAEGQEILRQAPYVDIVVGPQTYHHLPEMIEKAKRAEGRPRLVNTDFPDLPKFDYLVPSTKNLDNPFSAFLTIQEGCDKFCTFCCVPYTRGSEYSRPVVDILKEANHLVSLGAIEITLLGQNVNAYHGQSPLDSSSIYGLGALIEELANIDGLKRIRYTTSHPNDMDDHLIKVHGSIDKLMPFLHLPVQSGHDDILKRMNRRHTIAHYHDIIDRLRDVRPGIGFSSDFIVGFPGEMDHHFEATLDLVKKIKYSQAYSFTYSIRHGTPAGAFEDQIPEEVKKERLHRLQEQLWLDQMEFNQRCVGLTLPIIIDRKGRNPGQFIGRTPYMQSVVVENTHLGAQVDVDILSATLNSLSGHIKKVA